MLEFIHVINWCPEVKQRLDYFRTVLYGGLEFPFKQNSDIEIL